MRGKMATFKPRVLTIPGLVGLGALILLACAGPAPSNGAAEDQPADPPPEATTAPEEPPVSQVGPPASGGVPDVDLCQLLTVEEVASFAGGTPKNQPTTNRNGDIVDCWYTVVTAENTLGDIYIAYLTPAEWAAFGTGDPSEPVSGLGDSAFLSYSESEQQYRLLGWQGAIGFETIGTEEAVVRAMAEALVPRLADLPQ